MVEEPSSPQQQSPSQIIQGILDGLKLETELAVVAIEPVDDITIIEVDNEVSQD